MTEDVVCYSALVRALGGVEFFALYSSDPGVPGSDTPAGAEQAIRDRGLECVQLTPIPSTDEIIGDSIGNYQYCH